MRACWCTLLVHVTSDDTHTHAHTHTSSSSSSSSSYALAVRGSPAHQQRSTASGDAAYNQFPAGKGISKGTKMASAQTVERSLTVREKATNEAQDDGPCPDGLDNSLESFLDMDVEISKRDPAKRMLEFA